ncbi:C2H2 type master regulator of conidiophore development brlA [Hirsutella rhossiliensis]|uniref:C2H2 type master regulator of conidiophore development brlA n=1 Tax=Hirsutella rhossiliensis TaxID=111463 RepID=A0A9P8N3S7_9HYPO|nr:C2H2 type master regulator of conidiophore development brlA [Hirsutella rhossiliensis]KAH0966375.1 C2H2 type master regulator of conidiophore development brlA [Hirsutella rhossiliensis]
MQFESDFRFDMDDSFSMCSQAMSCPSTGTSFSSASSAYDPFTPTSRRSTPNELTLDFDNTACNSFATAHPGEMTPASNNGSNNPNMSKYMFGSVKAEPEQMPFPNSLPSTPLRKMDGMATPDYDHMLDMNLASQHMGSVTPSGPYPMYAISPHTAMPPGPFMMTPTHSLSGSDMADSSSTWSCANDSPISFFPQQQKAMAPHELEALDMERHSQSPLDRFHLNGPPTPGRLRAHRKMMVHEIQRKTTELQRAQIRASRKVAGQGDGTAVDVVRRAMCKCDYPGCHKAFRRNEHLKRHKQTFHGEGPNRFSCEFCGKDQFNRQDNLNNHRKLHARPNSRNRGVEFIPAAVPVIEQEERSRKRRAPPKSKMAEKRGDDY